MPRKYATAGALWGWQRRLPITILKAEISMIIARRSMHRSSM
jgi:hypothetical protein